MQWDRSFDHLVYETALLRSLTDLADASSPRQVQVCQSFISFAGFLRSKCSLLVEICTWSENWLLQGWYFFCTGPRHRSVCMLGLLLPRTINWRCSRAEDRIMACNIWSTLLSLPTVRKHGIDFSFPATFAVLHMTGLLIFVSASISWNIIKTEDTYIWRHNS